MRLKSVLAEESPGLYLNQKTEEHLRFGSFGEGAMGFYDGVAGTEEASVDLYVTVEYGQPIQKVAQDAQENVRRAIESMTGLHVVKVDVHVQGVSFEKENSALDAGAKNAMLGGGVQESAAAVQEAPVEQPAAEEAAPATEAAAQTAPVQEAPAQQAAPAEETEPDMMMM